MRFTKYLKSALVTVALAAVPMFAIAAPGQAAENAVGLATDDSLVTFSTTDPSAATVNTVTFPAGVTDTDLVGIDYRPRGGGLYGVASSGTFFVLAPGMAAGTFAATQINQIPLIPTYNFGGIGFDFNPAPDAIRLVTEDEDDFRFSPNNGSLLATDGNLAYAPGDPNQGQTPDIVAAGYTNAKDGTAGTGTTLYDIDSAQNTLVSQGSVNSAPVSPNSGQLLTVGTLGLDVTGNAGLDIAPGSGRGFAALETASATGSSNFYSVNLGSGSVESIGTIGGGKVLDSVTVAPASVIDFADTSISVDERAGSVEVVVTRTGGLNREVTVDYTASGEGTSGATGTLTFPVSNARQTFEVPVTNDIPDGSSKTIGLELSGPGANAILGDIATSMVKVIDVPAVNALTGPPVALVKVTTGRLGTVQNKGRVRIAYSSDRSAAVLMKVRFRGRTVGKAKRTLSKAGRSSLTIKIGPNNRKRIKKLAKPKSSIKLGLVARFTGDNGSVAKQKLRFRVIR